MVGRREKAQEGGGKEWLEVQAHRAGAAALALVELKGEESSMPLLVKPQQMHEMSDKALVSAHMQADAVLDSVCSNGELIQRRWAEQEEEGEDADEI